MADSPKERFKKECLRVINELHPLGYWLIPLTPFNVKKGDKFEAPWGGELTCEDDNHAGKRPLLKDWQSKRLTLQQLTTYFEKDPVYNLGVCCGVEQGLITVDVDYKNGGKVWLEQHGDKLASGLWEFTGNGVHIHFLPPTWTDKVPSLHSGTIAPGVELKSTGTQVVTYPSYHPTAKLASGKRRPYTFEHGCGLESREAEMEPLPEEFFKPLIALSNKPSTTKCSTGNSREKREEEFRDDPADAERLARILAERRAIEGQGGQTETFKLACIARDFNLSRKVCLEAMIPWNEQNASPPWELEDLKGIILNAYKYATGDQGAHSAADFLEDALAQASPGENESVVKELEEDTGPLPHNNPFQCANRYFRVHPFLYKIEAFWYWYDKKKRSWVKGKDRDMEDKLILDVQARAADDANIKPYHIKNIHRFLEALVARRTEIENPVLNRWLLEKADLSGDFIKFQNGILDLKTNALLPHDPRYFTLTMLDFKHDSEAKAPQFQTFLESLWSHEKIDPKSLNPVVSQANQLQRMLGYFISNEMRMHRYGLFIGVSRAGKGVLERTIKRFIGIENCMSTNLQTLGSAHGATRLPGKKLVLLSDAKDTRTSQSSAAMQILQNITGEDVVSVNPKGKDDFDHYSTAKLLMTVNKFPKWIDPQGALYNRTLLFNFTRSFAGKEDRYLEDRLGSEVAGIFNWVHAGYRLWRADGVLHNCPQVEPLLKDMQQTMNPIGAFVDTACIIFNSEDDKTWIGDTSGSWMPCDPPEDMFESKEAIWQAYLRSQREENAKFTLKRQSFLSQIQHELFARGLEPSWWENRQKRLPGDYGSKVTRVCLGIKLRAFTSAEEFEDLFEQLSDKDGDDLDF